MSDLVVVSSFLLIKFSFIDQKKKTKEEILRGCDVVECWKITAIYFVVKERKGFGRVREIERGLRKQSNQENILKLNISP